MSPTILDEQYIVASKLEIKKPDNFLTGFLLSLTQGTVYFFFKI